MHVLRASLTCELCAPVKKINLRQSGPEESQHHYKRALPLQAHHRSGENVYFDVILTYDDLRSRDVPLFQVVCGHRKCNRSLSVTAQKRDQIDFSSSQQGSMHDAVPAAILRQQLES